MINVPYKTPSFYSALFETPASNQIVSLMAPNFAHVIDKVQFLSEDFDSDINATNELQDGLNEVIKSLDLGEIDQVISFNPMYLPGNKKKLLEYDSDGDVSSIDGFQNPFVTAELNLSAVGYPVFAQGHVSFQSFDLPSMNDALNSKSVYVS